MSIIYWVIILTNFVFSSSAKDVSSQIYFSEHPVYLDTPIVFLNNMYYVPARAITNYFDGEITYSKRQNSYKIMIKEKEMTVKLNTKEYKVNNKAASFSSPPKRIHTRVYVPMHEFFSQLSISLTKKKSNFYAQSSEYPKKVINQKVSAKANHTPKNLQKFTYKKSPIYPNAQFIYLPISNKRLPFKVNHANYVNMTDFLIFIGYKIDILNQTALLKKNNQTFSFQHQSNTVKIIRNKHKRLEKNVSYTPIIDSKRKQVWFPLQAFLNDLGYEFSHQNKDIIILKKLHSIEYLNDNTIHISSNKNLNMPTPRTLLNPNRVFMDLPYTKCPDPIQPPKESLITSIVFGQNNVNCRIVFHTKKPVNGAISKSPTHHTLTFSPHTIKQKITKNTPHLKGKVVIIDPGHGGRDPGAVTKKNIYEKHFTLDISNRIKKELIKQGAIVHMLRSKDVNPSLYQRVKKINKLNGDIMISVHVNSFISDTANGTETYYYKASEKKLARYVQTELVNHLKLRNIGVKRANMYVLKYSNIPSILIEPCFITNPKELALLKTTAFRNNIAKGTVSGLKRYFESI